MMRKIIFIFFTIILITANVFPASGKFVVVIDAGHGGKDPGAMRGGFKEKNINLAIALQLGNLIESNLSDVKVIYTRKKDVFIPLMKRAEIANSAKANLFISIHTNSSGEKTTDTSGADTYMLGLAKSAENLNVAKRENSVILLENDYTKKYEGFDPNSPESYIMFEFLVSKYMDQSFEFASYVQKYFRSVAHRPNRGVRQAGFLVLKETSMPSVLIEVGYVNNPTEAHFLMSKDGQRKMASSIFLAFKKYKSDFDKHQGSYKIGSASNNSNIEKKKEPVLQQIIHEQQEKRLAQENDQKTNTEEDENNSVILKPATPVISLDSTESNSNGEKYNVDGKAEEAETPTSVKKEFKLQAENGKIEQISQPKTKSNNPNIIEYRVQIFISQTKVPKSSRRFKGLNPDEISYYQDKKVYKYTFGATTSITQAMRIQKIVKSKFPDSFVVKFRNNERIN